MFSRLTSSLASGVASLVSARVAENVFSADESKTSDRTLTVLEAVADDDVSRGLVVFFKRHGLEWNVNMLKQRIIESAELSKLMDVLPPPMQEEAKSVNAKQATLLERIASAVEQARALYHDPTTIVTKMLADLSTIQQVGIMRSKEKLVEFVSTIPLKKQRMELPEDLDEVQAFIDQRHLTLQFMAFRRGFAKFRQLQTIVTGLNKMSAELFELDQVRGDIFMSFAHDKVSSIATAIGISVNYVNCGGDYESPAYDTTDAIGGDPVHVAELKGDTLKIAKARYLHGQAFSKPKMDKLRQTFGRLTIANLERLRSVGDISEAKLMEELEKPPAHLSEPAVRMRDGKRRRAPMRCQFELPNGSKCNKFGHTSRKCPSNPKSKNYSPPIDVSE